MRLRGSACLLVAVAVTLAAACGDDASPGTRDAGRADGAGSLDAPDTRDAATSDAPPGTDSGACGPMDAPCSAEGATCMVAGTCCPSPYLCRSGRWQQQPTSSCLPAPCPGALPEDGSSCPCTAAIFGPLTCPYEGGCTVAACDGTAWSVARPAGCTTPCGDVERCAAAQVCVRTEAGVGIRYHCETNPCAGQPLSCACAAPLCPSPPQVCAVEDDVLACTCPMCA